MPSGVLRPSTIALALVAGLVLLALSSVQSARPALAATNCSVNDSFDSEERAFLNLINQYRAQSGRSALTVSTNLNRAAAWHAHDMATKRYFSHTDSLKRAFSTRLSQCDARPSFGENIAAGTNSSGAQSAFTMWRNSSGHNANMLNSSYRQIGIARYYDASSPYKWYWVTTFSTSNDGTNAAGGSSGGSSGGGSAPPPAPTATPKPPSQPPAAPVTQPAKLTSPKDGATLSNSVTFSWNAVSGAQGYRILIGTSKGAGNLLTGNLSASTRSVRISGFPATGQKIYFRLETRLASGTVYSDYVFTLPR